MANNWFVGLENLSDLNQDDQQENSKITNRLWETIQNKIDKSEFIPIPNENVTVRELNDDGESYFVLKNTVEKTYLRLSLLEHYLWLQMSKALSVKELIVEHYVKTGKFGHNLINHLVEQLHNNHMLETSPITIWQTLHASMEKRSWLSKVSTPAMKLISQRLAIKGIDKWVGLLYKTIGWIFFTKVFKVLFLLISLSGLFAFFNILGNPNYVFLGDNLLLEIATLWFVMIFPILIHELGHALTVKHYKREVPQGGVMLYFGMPAAFVETTDIWLEPRKARLAVTWNGPYTGLIIGGLASLLMFFNPHASYNPFLFKLTGVAYATVFFNVNPLLKFDGYYLLVDMLNIPLLREKSISFVRRKLFPKLVKRKTFTKNEKIFSVFGGLSLIWTIYALYFISSLWIVRVQGSLVIILGESYLFVVKFFNILVLGAMLSFAFLILLSIYRIINQQILKFSKSGGLINHKKLALLLAGLLILINIVFSLAIPDYHPLISQAITFIFSLYAIFILSKYLQNYSYSPRGWVYLALILSLLLASLTIVFGFIPELSYLVESFQFVCLLPLLASGLFLTWNPLKRIGLINLLLGLLIGIIFLVLIDNFAQVSSSNANIILIAMMLVGWSWSYQSIKGSARTPAFTIMWLGGIVSAASAIIDYKIIDVWSLGILLISASAIHVVFAKIPDLSVSKTQEVSDKTQHAIGLSVSVIVRRIIAQIFFESGWAGARLIGTQFTKHMTSLGVDLSIEKNVFVDNELYQRNAVELTDVYSFAFDNLCKIIRKEFGYNFAITIFGYGVDLLPWQNREIISDLVLSRQEWGGMINENLQVKMENRITLMNRVPFLSDANEQELKEIASSFTQEIFAVNENVIVEGESGRKFYIIEKGKVNVYRSSVSGIEEIIDEKGPGQYFGEWALISSDPRNATVKAATPLTVLSVGRKKFDIFIKNHLAIGNRIKSRFSYSWLLRGMTLFDELDNHELELLAKNLKPEVFSENEVVLKEGEVGDKFYIVETGELSVLQKSGGEDKEISRRGPGDYFGEIALLENRARTATIISLSETKLLSLEAKYFTSLTSKFLNLNSSIKNTGTRRLKYIQTNK